jgi:hypothetical protein
VEDAWNTVNLFPKESQPIIDDVLIYGALNDHFEFMSAGPIQWMSIAAKGFAYMKLNVERMRQRQHEKPRMMLLLEDELDRYDESMRRSRFTRGRMKQLSK